MPGDTIEVMSNVYLVGFMGAGKTSVGKALADRLGYEFLDLDQLLATRFEGSISGVFEVHGEEAFREAETAELRRTTGRDRLVVATGGGAFCSDVNRLVIAGCGGISVFLDVPWEMLQGRLRGATSHRPMYGDAASARDLLARRQADYRRATITVSITKLESPEETADRIVETLREVACAT